MTGTAGSNERGRGDYPSFDVTLRWERDLRFEHEPCDRCGRVHVHKPKLKFSKDDERYLLAYLCGIPPHTKVRVTIQPSDDAGGTEGASSGVSS